MPSGFSGKPNSSLFFNQAGDLSSSSTASNKVATSVTISYPINVVTGNLLVLWAARNSGIPSLSAPWNLIASAQNINGVNGYTRCYSRIVTETGLSGTLSVPFSCAIILNLKYYRINSSSIISKTTSSSFLSLTPVFGDYSLLLYGCRALNIFTMPALVTELIDYNGGTGHTYSLGSCRANSSDIKTITRTSTSNEFFGMSLGLV